MPSSKPQFNVRLDAVGMALVAELPGVIEAKIGTTISQADLIRMALVALAREYAHPLPKPSPDSPPKKGRKKGETR